jgi:hypothetical protein
MRRPRKHSLKFDDELMRRFVGTFEQFDELDCLPGEPPPPDLFAGMNAYDWACWQRYPSFRDLMCETIDLALSKHD